MTRIEIGLVADLIETGLSFTNEIVTEVEGRETGFLAARYPISESNTRLYELRGWEEVEPSEKSQKRIFSILLMQDLNQDDGCFLDVINLETSTIEADGERSEFFIRPTGDVLQVGDEIRKIKGKIDANNENKYE